MLNIRLWKSSYFTRFCGGAAISLLGNWFLTIAVAVLIFKLTGQVSSVGLLIAAQIAPRLLLAPLGGAIADRFERRRLLIVLDSTRALVTLLPLFVHNASSLWVLYLAVVLLQICGCIYSPAQSAYLPLLITDDLLESANATYTIMRDSSIFIGPALATVVLSLWGSAVAFAGDALSFAISAAVLLTLPRSEQGAKHRLSPRTIMAGYTAIIRRYPRIAPLYLCCLAAIAPIFYFQAIMVVYMKTIGQPTSSLGMLYAAAGLGGTLGGLVMSHYLRRMPHGLAVSIFALSAPVLGAVALVHDAWLALFLVACSTVAGTTGDLVFAVNVQRYVLPEERGRAFGLWTWCIAVGQLIGACVSIAVSTAVAVPGLLWVSLAALPIVAIGGWLSVNARHPISLIPAGTAVEGTS